VKIEVLVEIWKWGDRQKYKGSNTLIATTFDFLERKVG